MNKEFLELISIIEESELPFPWEFHTNGCLLTSGLAEQLVDRMRSGLVFVSIDGGTQTTHDMNRGKGAYEAAIRGATNLLRARGSRSTPRIGIFQLSVGVPEADYDPRFIELTQSVDEWVRIPPAHPVSGKRMLTEEIESGTSLVRRPSTRWWTHAPDSRSGDPWSACFWAGNAFFISPTGDVSICLFSSSSEGVVGNLLSEPLEIVLKRAMQFRDRINTEGRPGVLHCRDCKMAEGAPHIAGRS